MSLQSLYGLEDGIGPPGTRVIGGGKLPKVGAYN